MTRRKSDNTDIVATDVIGMVIVVAIVAVIAVAVLSVVAEYLATAHSGGTAPTTSMTGTAD